MFSLNMASLYLILKKRYILVLSYIIAQIRQLSHCFVFLNLHLLNMYQKYNIHVVSTFELPVKCIELPFSKWLV